MSVICIARELGALGDETVRELSVLTGFRPLDKEYLETRMTELGMKPETRIRYDEKKPGFWASLSQDRDDYLHFLTCVLYEEVAKGDCIVSGRGGFAILAGVPAVVRVKLVAPLEKRIERLRQRYSCDAKRAHQLVKQSDHDRKGFHDYFFNVDWDDPRSFDLVINTGHDDARGAALIVDALRRHRIGPDAEAAHKARMAELLLGRAVISEVVYKHHVPVHFLEADASGSTITLRGVTNTQAAIDAAVTAAKSVPGVGEVKNCIQIVQEFAVMP